MNEQATALQEYIRRKNLQKVVREREKTTSEGTRVSTVTSGKGGVGKTTIALNMALASEKKTLVVDGDLYMGDLATFTNESSNISWGQIIWDHEKWPDGIIKLSNTTDVFAPTSLENFGDEGKSVSKALLHLLGQWRKEYDYIIIDTATGLGAQVLEWCLAADQVILVVTPDPAACTDGYALLKALHLTGEVREMGVLVNQYLESDDPSEIFAQLVLLSERFLDREIHNYGTIPWSTEVITASRDQRPVLRRTPESGLRKDFRLPLTHIEHTHPKEHKYVTISG